MKYIRILFPVLFLGILLSCGPSHIGTYLPEGKTSVIDDLYVIKKIEITGGKGIIHLVISPEKKQNLIDEDNPDLTDCIKVASQGKKLTYGYEISGTTLRIKNDMGDVIQSYALEEKSLTAPMTSLYGGVFTKKGI